MDLIRSRLYLTSCAVTLAPLWNVTPERRLNVGFGPFVNCTSASYTARSISSTLDEADCEGSRVGGATVSPMDSVPETAEAPEAVPDDAVDDPDDAQAVMIRHPTAATRATSARRRRAMILTARAPRR